MLTEFAAACTGDDGETLRVYSGRHYGIENAFEQFTEETGIEVRVIDEQFTVARVGESEEMASLGIEPGLFDKLC